MNSMNVPVWIWLVFYLAVLLMLVADLMMFGRKGQHEVSALSYTHLTLPTSDLL